MGDRITIQALGGGQIVRNIEAWMQNADRVVSEEVQLAALATLQDAQDDCPVDRGDLRDSGEMNNYGDPMYAEVEFSGDSERDYALFVEEGHHTRDGSWVPPQPFLLPNFEIQAHDLVTHLERLFG